MSLLIMKNTNGQSSSSFENDYKNSFEIEKDSEVALHSISFNRLPKYDMSQRFFYVYHGEEMDQDGDTFLGNEPLSMVDKIEISNNAYGYDELATEIQKQLKLQDTHPNYQQNWTCSPNMYGGANQDQFEGMNITCGQLAPVAKTTSAASSQVPETIVKPSGVVARAYSIGTETPVSITYNSTTGKLTSTTTDPFVQTFVRSKYPTNLNYGECIIDFDGMFDFTATEVFINQFNAVGIGRNYEFGFGLGHKVTGEKHEEFDIWMEIEDADIGESKKGDLRLFQNIMAHDINTGTYGMVEQEIFYYKQYISGVKQNDADPISDLKMEDRPYNFINPPTSFSGTYNSIRFNFGNEHVSISIGDSANSTTAWTRLSYTYTKPISYSNYAVYPKVSLGESEHCLFFHQDEVATYQPVVASVRDRSLQELVIMQQENIWKADRNVSTRQNDLVFEAIKGIVDTPGEMAHLDFPCVVISGHVPGYEYYNAPLANINRILVYEKSVLTHVTTAETTADAAFEPTTPLTPQYDALTGDTITFIRCPSLTQRSLNGDTKSLSSIICDIPRFIGNDSFGKTYYAPANKTYLKLHNKEKVFINRLNIEIVNSNEMIVSDLQGNTTILLHIRKSQN